MLVASAARTLAKCARSGTAKVRWNACHALGSLLRAKSSSDYVAGKNSSGSSSSSSSSPLSLAGPPPAWTAAALGDLLAAMQTSPNFKVRINAAAALAAPVSAAAFGPPATLESTLETLLVSGLPSAEDAADFAAAQYAPALRRALGLAIAQLLLLAFRPVNAASGADAGQHPAGSCEPVRVAAALSADGICDLLSAAWTSAGAAHPDTVRTGRPSGGFILVIAADSCADFTHRFAAAWRLHATSLAITTHFPRLCWIKKAG